MKSKDKYILAIDLGTSGPKDRFNLGLWRGGGQRIQRHPHYPAS